MRRLARVLSILGVSFLLTGCGGSETVKGRPQVFAVNGKLTYKGQPVKNADVTFVCKDQDRSAFGRTNDQGEFQLTTFASNDGAVAGKHTVVVSKLEDTENKPVAPIESPDYIPPTPESVARAARSVKNSLPKKYADAKSSDLIAVVSGDGGPNEMNLELKD
jgi:hypothetical protein